LTIDEVMKCIKDEGISQVDLKTTDIWGRWRHVTLASTYFSEKTFTEGVGFDASNLGYGNVVQSDLLMIPDPSTAFIEEREGQRLISMICDVYSVDNGKPSPLDPRGSCVKRLVLFQTLLKTSCWHPSMSSMYSTAWLLTWHLTKCSMV